MAKMKIVPKALIVAAVIGAVGFGLTRLDLKPKQEVAAQAPVEQVAAAPETAPEPVAVAQAPVAAPAVLTPAPLAPVPVPLAEGGAGIASGQKTGTNWPMVENITQVCSRPDRPLHNVVSDGGLDNTFKIYSDKNTQFGVIPEDTLAYQAKLDPKMMSRVVAVFPFFSVEIHAIAVKGSPINSLADLQGKRVVEGPEGSGTWVTVQRIKQLTGLTWTPIILSQTEGLKAVQTGQADVEFVVAGQPISMFTPLQDVKLIPISHPALDNDKYYTRTLLPSSAYPFLGTSVPTYKLNNVLATFAYKNQYQAEITDLVTCIVRNMDNLQKNGHPKWKSVDPLDITRVAWPVHPAALAAIKREAKKQ